MSGTETNQAADDKPFIPAPETPNQTEHPEEPALPVIALQALLEAAEILEQISVSLN